MSCMSKEKLNRYYQEAFAGGDINGILDEVKPAALAGDEGVERLLSRLIETAMCRVSEENDPVACHVLFWCWVYESEEQMIRDTIARFAKSYLEKQRELAGAIPPDEAENVKKCCGLAWLILDLTALLSLDMRSDIRAFWEFFCMTKETRVFPVEEYLGDLNVIAGFLPRFIRAKQDGDRAAANLVGNVVRHCMDSVRDTGNWIDCEILSVVAENDPTLRQEIHDFFRQILGSVYVSRGQSAIAD